MFRTLSSFLAAAVLLTSFPLSTAAKSYSSGGGKSYSSSSSRSSGGSRSSGSSSSRSSGSSSSRTSGSKSSSSGGSRSSTPPSSASRSSDSSSRKSTSESSSKSYRSTNGKSYSSGSSWSDSGRHSYSSSKSYSSGSGRNFTPDISAADSETPSQTLSRTRKSDSDSSSPAFSFDTSAARARKEEASRREFERFKESFAAANKPAPAPVTTPSEPMRAPADVTSAPGVQPPPLPPPARRPQRETVYIPDQDTLYTRSTRSRTVFNPYYSRPVVVYHDPYNSFFWWWLLDRAVEDRASWAYHHRYDMDPARYQALLSTDQQLETRVAQLEAQQTPRNPSYVPSGMDRDLMYSDRYVTHTYSNRSTTLGVVLFLIIAIPTALAVCAFFIWLIWFKRWQTAT